LTRLGGHGKLRAVIVKTASEEGYFTLDNRPILRIVRPDEDDLSEALDPNSYAGRIARATAELRVFLNDPVALIARAQALLEGTAEPLL
jgi:hypothetical protein